jgi:hypothetical protein
VSATNTMQAFGSIFEPLADGITPSSGLIEGGGTATVTQTGTPSESVQITPGSWVIPGPAPTTQGAFLWTPGTSNQTVGPFDPADATNPRIDIIVAQVNSPGDAATAGDASYNIVKGTPAATPAVPGTPTGAVFVRQVRRNVGDTTITNARITGAPSVARVRRRTDMVTAPTKTNARVWWGTVTATTDSTGRITWTHGTGVTPGVIVIEGQAPESGSFIAAQHITDTHTSTTARTRWFNVAGVALASSSVTFRWVAYA